MGIPMEDTVFHKIIRREIPAEIVQESDNYIAIRDINPVAPVHILIIPKKTIPSVAHVSSEDAAILGGLLVAAKAIAEEHGLS